MSAINYSSAREGIINKLTMKKAVSLLVRQPVTLPEMEAYYQVRYDVLRKPLGMSKGTEKANPIIKELSGVHFVAYTQPEQKMIGAAMGFVGEDFTKIHALCVYPEYQKCHAGKELMRALEDELKRRGGDKVFLNARLDVQIFYEKLGYVVVKHIDTVEAKRLTGMDIPFVRMEKSLVRNPII